MRRRQDEKDEPQGQEKESFFRKLLGWFLAEFREEGLFLVAGAVAATVRAMGVTVESGQTGLRFTFGRATKLLDPGFHPLMPFVMKARKVPTRARTLDLPAQRVVTFDGLVYHADANLVYRVVDVRKALIQIDNLGKGMLQMLGLGVQEVLRGADQKRLQILGEMDEELAKNLEQRLAPWGVAVERAGFSSITPSQMTLRLTQLRHQVEERREMLAHIEAGGLARRSALTLMGTRTRYEHRTRGLQARHRRHSLNRYLRKKLMQRGWLAVQMKQAGRTLRRRVTPRGTLKAGKAKSGTTTGPGRRAAQSTSTTR